MEKKEMEKSSVKGIKEFYDDTAMMWTDEWYDNTTMMPFLEKVASMLPKGARVLDLGCNSGYETRRMKELGLEPVGLDFSKKCIDIAKERNNDIEFVCDDMLNDLTYLGKFDSIVAIASIIHIPADSLELCFKRIYDILNDNGYLCMVVRNEIGKLDASYKTIDNQDYDREVYGFSKEFIDEKINGKFVFVEEMVAHDEHWKYYFYKKV